MTVQILPKSPSPTLPSGSSNQENALAAYTRHMGLFPLDKHMETRILVAGVGAIGSWIARMLVMSGAQHLTIVDPDVVSVENLSPQGYLPSQIGMKKVNALCDSLLEINPKARSFILENDKFKPPADRVIDVVFQCTDSMDARKEIFMWARQNCKLFLDGRMSGGAMTLHTWYPGRKWDYLSTLFPQSEAYPEPCTARATNYCAATAASTLVSFYTAWLQGRPIPHTYKTDFQTWTSEVLKDGTLPPGSPILG